jgi:hypothetical protein
MLTGWIVRLVMRYVQGGGWKGDVLTVQPHDLSFAWNIYM